jgi:hypothetical protein
MRRRLRGIRLRNMRRRLRGIRRDKEDGMKVSNGRKWEQFTGYYSMHAGTESYLRKIRANVIQGSEREVEPEHVDEEGKYTGPDLHK